MRSPSRLRLSTSSAIVRSAARRWIIAWFVVALMFWLVLSIGKQAFPAVRAYGFSFLTGSTWDLNKEQFRHPARHHRHDVQLGARPHHRHLVRARDRDFSERGFSLVGTAGGSQAVHLEETRPFASLPDRLEDFLKVTIELLAAIPSVVYGLWGIFVIIPLVRPWADWLHGHLGWIPFFGTPLSGPGLMPASIVLAIMVLPTISAISRDALVAVPPKMREAAFGMGATRWEAILAIFIPDRGDRNLRRRDPRIRARARRDDGARDARGQRQRHQLVAVLAGQHARRRCWRIISPKPMRSRWAR